MENNVFHKILDFAIIKEYDSEKIYRELATRLWLKRYATFFDEIARSEIVHAKYLENIRCSNAGILLPKIIVQNFAITRNIPQIDLGKLNSVYNVLQFCAQEEEMVSKLYTAVAQNSQNCQIAQIFSKLAQEEANHQRIFSEKLTEWVSAAEKGTYEETQKTNSRNSHRQRI